MGLKRKFPSPLALAGLLAMPAPAVLAGTYYQWTNERGTIVHSDRPPPPGVDYEVVSTDSGLKRVVEGEEGAVPLDLESKPGNEFVQHQKNPEAFEKNPVTCERAQKDLETLTTSAEVAVRNDQGELRYLTPEEIKAETTKAQATIELHCD